MCLKFFKPIYVFIMLVFIGIEPAVSATANVFMSAHQDDWQLFMNPGAYYSVKGSDKTVFIHVTAGDAGSGGSSTYYTARNEGSLRAIRFIVNAGGGSLGIDMNEEYVEVNGHSIKKYTYGRAVAYFLNIPDGNLFGEGFSGTGNQSLELLYNGGIGSIVSIDESASYDSWNDLQQTVEEIIRVEVQGADTLYIHAADTDSGFNPGDHSDHIHTSLLAQSAQIENICSNLRLYQDYATEGKPINVSTEELLIQAGTWGVTTSGLADFSASSTWDDDHNAWLGRQYYREVEGQCGVRCLNEELNIAHMARTSASSENVSTSQTSDKAVDGIIEGYPGDFSREWASNFELNGAWLQLDWDDEVSVSEIVLYDRPNSSDHITGASIIFSDESTIEVPVLNNDGSSVTVTLPEEKITSSLRLLITDVADSTINVGLSEIEVLQACDPES